MSLIWIQGSGRSGKSQRACEQFCTWVETEISQQSDPQAGSQTVLVLSVDAEQRRLFSDRLSHATHGQYPVTATTPIGFFRDQVLLFFPLLVRTLRLKAQFPILLRVENEQELAMNLWAEDLEEGRLRMEGVSRDRLVRRLLDLYLLAANSGKAIDEIPAILQQGLESDGNQSTKNTYAYFGTALTAWQQFCWQHGLLTYGVITELFGRYLLPNPQYQAKLCQRFRYIIADDVDEYPAIVRQACEVLIAAGASAVFTFNPQGGIRQGLGADPDYWSDLAAQCDIVNLSPTQDSLGDRIGAVVLDSSVNPIGSTYFAHEPLQGLVSIETISRAKLFRSVADAIAAAITTGQIQAKEIAIIAPGLDNIASYAIVEILTKKGIDILPLNDQHPLSGSALVRSLLTLMPLIYPKLGHQIDRDRVAEMLVSLDPRIDPVRAGILADRCFQPHPDRPQLLPSDTYSEWHRLGYEVSHAYEQLRQWIEQQTASLAPLLFLDRAIQKFFVPRNLSYDRIANLQALIETAQHYWEIGYRLGWQDGQIIEQFIKLIRQGTVTANPYAPRTQSDSVTLATIYQYRMARLQHRWQFWLDASSPLWKQGGAADLFAAPLFLHGWHGEPWSIQDENDADRWRLERLLRDLLDRATERVYLCYSELSTNGQLQTGPLLSLADISTTLADTNIIDYEVGSALRSHQN
ncbi:hypothetical protein [Pseudanabaena sp. PCC 6802]|uniref:hypothetical protein n=1 Tax=Pseudanabaena sp. PCC 6802 TaxID=118173 RepID=UPI0003468655|nr:hypothetical protein [Pseudanabaena sp. PCC 6802]